MKAGLIAAWYDFWIGAFYDRKKRRLYVFPLPCLGFWVEHKLSPALWTALDSAVQEVPEGTCPICNRLPQFTVTHANEHDAELAHGGTP